MSKKWVALVLGIVFLVGLTMAGCGRGGDNKPAAAGGEIDLTGLRAQRRRYLGTGLLHRAPRVAAHAVDGAGIACLFREKGQHFGKDFRPYRRGGGVIQINGRIRGIHGERPRF